MFVLGDMRIGQVWVVTPFGTAPMHGAHFHAQESYLYEQRTPQWAIITGVITAVFCLLGLLFLLCKEPVAQPVVDITVTSGAFRHTTRVRTYDPMTTHQIMTSVARAQQLADNAPVAG